MDWLVQRPGWLPLDDARRGPAGGARRRLLPGSDLKLAIHDRFVTAAPATTDFGGAGNYAAIPAG
ncbi:hypothetical protein [Mycobacterium decipiens]|uniref:Uncharacterized protein n=1 Tax=Mycobacterium decipiens TaxID=1430326 RepID=A0A1X2LYP2_9MYCO|nr:hypothetical protein [Mycobacterium decipiens]OSC42341.1 hypothetical protein B8W66_05050 [Mycobacterium decipiens]